MCIRDSANAIIPIPPDDGRPSSAPFNPITSSSCNRLTSSFTWWSRPMNFTYFANLGVIDLEEHEFLNDEVPPIHSYWKIGQTFLTMCTRRCLTRHWRHDKFWQYSPNTKIAHANLIHLSIAKFRKLHNCRTSPFPVWTISTLGFWKGSIQASDVPNLGEID